MTKKTGILKSMLLDYVIETISGDDIGYIISGYMSRHDLAVKQSTITVKEGLFKKEVYKVSINRVK